jgi:hypothetical protein
MQQHETSYIEKKWEVRAERMKPQIPCYGGEKERREMKIK